MDQGRRLDQWLWYSRLFKSRTGAQSAIETGAIRVNRVVVVKPAHLVRPGDVLTFVRGSLAIVVRVLAAGHRRGPAAEAASLYEIVEPGA